MRCAASTSCCCDVGGLVGEPVRRTDPLRELHELHLGRCRRGRRADRGPTRRCPSEMSASYIRASDASERSTPNASPMLSGSDDACETAPARCGFTPPCKPDAVERLVLGVREAVEIATEPAGRGRAGTAPSVHPDVGRREVAEVGRLVADAAHDRDLALVEARLELHERRVQREPAADRVAVRDLERRPQRGVGGSPTGATMLRPSLPPLRKIVMRMPWLSATGGAANAWSFERYGLGRDDARGQRAALGGTAAATPTGGRTRSGQARFISGLSITSVSRLMNDQFVHASCRRAAR